MKMDLLLRLAFPLFLGTLFLVVIAGENQSYIKIAAFNIQIFGVKKAANPDVMPYIVKIIQQYDLVLIQEIRDKSQGAMFKLLGQLDDAKTPYHMRISKRLGRTSSKEQYAFLYRKGSGIRFEDSFTFDDGLETLGTDTFQREPYVARFSFENLPFKYINFIAIHADPGSAVSELQHLSDVYKETLKRWNNEEVMILGDLNADCSYVPKKAWPSIPLRSDEFYWPIGDGNDTTTTGSDCAYDRFIIAGKDLIDLSKRGKTVVFKFDEAFGLNNTFTKSISDHYPIVLYLPMTASTTTTPPPSSAAAKFEKVQPLLKHLLSSKCAEKMLKEANLDMKDFEEDLSGVDTEAEYLDRILEV